VSVQGLSVPVTVKDGPTQARIRIESGALTLNSDSSFALVTRGYFPDYPNTKIEPWPNGTFPWTPDAGAIWMDFPGTGGRAFFGVADPDTVRLYAAFNGVPAPGAVYDYTFARR
jgi:hypothetical protein